MEISDRYIPERQNIVDASFCRSLMGYVECTKDTWQICLRQEETVSLHLFFSGSLGLEERCPPFALNLLIL